VFRKFPYVHIRGIGVNDFYMYINCEQLRILNIVFYYQIQNMNEGDR